MEGTKKIIYTYKNTFIFYMHIRQAIGIARKETLTWLRVDLYIYYSMNKQYVEGVQNEKRLTWLSVGNTARHLYSSNIRAK